MFNFPTIYLESVVVVVFFLISVCLFSFYFILICFVFVFVFFLLPKIPSPFISNGAPLSLFYHTDDGGDYVIDNFELPSIQ